MQTIEELKSQVAIYVAKTLDIKREIPGLQEATWFIERIPYELFDAFYKSLPASKGRLFELTPTDRLAFIYHPFEGCQIIFRSIPVKITATYSVQNIV